VADPGAAEPSSVTVGTMWLTQAKLLARRGQFAAVGRGSSRWPLRLCWMISKVNHIGGLYAGAALAGTAWLVPSPWSPRSLAPAGLRLWT